MRNIPATIAGAAVAVYLWSFDVGLALAAGIAVAVLVALGISLAARLAGLRTPFLRIERIALRSLRHRALSNLLTGFSLALGVALVISVLLIYALIEQSFNSAARGYQLIVGATKGGRLQLVLNTVYHISRPIENVPWEVYEEFTEPGGRFTELTEVAIPFCLGDSYEGYRVVGTSRDLFDKIQWADGKNYEFAAGRNFESDHFFEAVVGSLVARRLGLKVGDKFAPTHGVTSSETPHQHDDEFTIVGILAPTGTPNDRALFVNLEGFYLLDNHARDPDEFESLGQPTAAQPDHDHDHPAAHDHPAEHEHDPSKPQAEPADRDQGPADKHAHDGEHGPDHKHADEDDHEHAGKHDHDHAHAHDHDHDHDHGHHHHTPLPKEQREVTAILVKCHEDLLAGVIHTMINKGQQAQAVFPSQEISQLFEDIVGNLRLLVLVLAVLVVVVSAIGITVAIYNSMSERRREIAVMRALGASRLMVVGVMLDEAFFLALFGGLAGIGLAHLLFVALRPLIEVYTGAVLPVLAVSEAEPMILGVLAALAAVVGLLPAVAAYRTDVSRNLT